MAEPDDVASRYGTGTGILDPILAFSPNLTLEEIKRRRAIAGALASRSRPFPKTVGEGMTYFGESLAEAIGDYTTGQAEKGYNARYDKAANVPSASDTLPPPPPVTPGPSASLLTGPQSSPLVTSNASLDTGAAGSTLDGATFAEEGGPNPPIITAQIRPMQMAQATPRPGALPAAPVQPTAQPGGTLAPVIPESLPDPVQPMRSERLTPNEQYRADVLRRFPGDPRAIEEYRRAHELGKAARDAEYDRQKEEYNVKLRAKEAREAAIQAAKTNAPKTAQELAEGAARLSAAQDAEQARIFHGNLPPPVAKALEESKEKATLSASAIEAVNNAREAQKYAVSGLGADATLLWHRAQAALGNRESQRIVQASETYKANLVPIMQTMLKSLAGKDISTKELDFIRSVSGADLSLDKESADRMLTIAERLARQDVQSHRDTVETMIRGQREEALPALRKLYSVRDPLSGVPLSETTATSGGYKEGDIARGKPGQPDLVRRGGKWVPM
jgi:hypothetical protein